MPVLEDDADRLVSEYCDICDELFADCECHLCPQCYDNEKVVYCGRCGRGAVL